MRPFETLLLRQATALQNGEEKARKDLLEEAERRLEHRQISIIIWNQIVDLLYPNYHPAA